MNSDSLALACYKQIAVLHPDHPVYVVQHETSGKLYVKKVLSQYNKSVFQQLMANPVMGTPCIREVVEMDGLLYVIEDYIPGDTLQRGTGDHLPLATVQTAPDAVPEHVPGLYFLETAGSRAPSGTGDQRRKL